MPPISSYPRSAWARRSGAPAPCALGTLERPTVRIAAQRRHDRYFIVPTLCVSTPLRALQRPVPWTLERPTVRIAAQRWHDRLFPAYELAERLRRYSAN